MPISSTQQNIEISGIKDGIVLLRDGSYRIILSCSTINFALKSEQEQNALIFQYQSFLNSLHFPIEIVMQSKKLDLTPYLKKINDLHEKQTNDLIRLQTEDYIDFVGKLINMANIMKKSFFAVVPFQPISLKGNTFLDRIIKKKLAGPVKIEEEEFKHHKEELLERANTVATGLGSMGIQCVQLNTEEIIELFYKIYNPDVSNKERIEDANKLTSSYVASKTEERTEAENTEQPERVIDNTAIVQQKQKEDSKFNKYKSEKEQGAADQSTQSKAEGQKAETEASGNAAQ